uniref:Claudin n=1 Tax=Anabas testudineus TaxID=64144 RepID=A0AAQ6ID71_ANATE
MTPRGFHLPGILLACLGFVGDIIICALPMWKVPAIIDQNMVTAQLFYEGLWMSCVMQSTGQFQCKVYDSMLALPPDLQASRALVVISILVAFLGILLSIAGGKYATWIKDEAAKNKIAIVGGLLFIISGLLCLISVCWSANTIIRDNPLFHSSQRRELGASLFIGCISAGLLLIGGEFLYSMYLTHVDHFSL